MIYIKYAECSDNDASRHETAARLRDGILYSAFGVKCADKAVKETDSGKPYIKGTDLDFSVAHTRCAAVAAVCGSGGESEDCICTDENVRRIGADIEYRSRRIDPLSLERICKRFYSKKEREYVAAGTKGDGVRFLEVWTRKESMVKATGEGLYAMRAADSFSEKIKYIKTDCINVGGEEYILSITGI